MARSRTSTRGRWTPTTACSAPSSRARSRAPASSARTPLRRRRWTSVADLHFNGGSIGGSGLGAFNVWGVDIRVEGGAQDGVGKTMFGGTIADHEGPQPLGQRVNGSVGKSFAYGAQRGRFFVQGSADSRFCIRLSGADVVIGGRARRADPRRARRDRRPRQHQGLRVRVHDLRAAPSCSGDIGPWACAGQTGGRVYMRVNDEWGLDREALERRLGKGAKVALLELDDEGVADVQELLGHYAARARALRAARGGAARARDRRRREDALPDVGAGARADRPVGLDRVARSQLRSYAVTRLRGA